MPPNQSFTKFQKERKRQEKAAAKRQERNERRRRSANAPSGLGPPIDYTRPPDDLRPLPAVEEKSEPSQ